MLLPLLVCCSIPLVFGAQILLFQTASLRSQCMTADQKVVCTGFLGRYLYAFYISFGSEVSEPMSSARMAKSRLFWPKEFLTSG